jgi:hypothetical protein
LYSGWTDRAEARPGAAPARPAGAVRAFAFHFALRPARRHRCSTGGAAHDGRGARDGQTERLARLAREEGRSQADILRAAIEAYHPPGSADRRFALAAGFRRIADDPRPISEIPDAELLEGFGYLLGRRFGSAGRRAFVDDLAAGRLRAVTPLRGGAFVILPADA